MQEELTGKVGITVLCFGCLLFPCCWSTAMENRCSRPQCEIVRILGGINSLVADYLHEDGACHHFRQSQISCAYPGPNTALCDFCTKHNLTHRPTAPVTKQGSYIVTTFSNGRVWHTGGCSLGSCEKFSNLVLGIIQWTAQALIQL